MKEREEELRKKGRLERWKNTEGRQKEVRKDGGEKAIWRKEDREEEKEYR